MFPLVHLWCHSTLTVALGQTENIIFDSNTITTEDDAASWTDIDWVKKPFDIGLRLQRSLHDAYSITTSSISATLSV